MIIFLRQYRRVATCYPFRFPGNGNGVITGARRFLLRRGISYPTGLPSLRDLVDTIYHNLDTTKQGIDYFRFGVDRASGVAINFPNSAYRRIGATNFNMMRYVDAAGQADCYDMRPTDIMGEMCVEAGM